MNAVADFRWNIRALNFNELIVYFFNKSLSPLQNSMRDKLIFKLLTRDM